VGVGDGFGFIRFSFNCICFPTQHVPGSSCTLPTLSLAIPDHHDLLITSYKPMHAACRRVTQGRYPRRCYINTSTAVREEGILIPLASTQISDFRFQLSRNRHIHPSLRPTSLTSLQFASLHLRTPPNPAQARSVSKGPTRSHLSHHAPRTQISPSAPRRPVDHPWDAHSPGKVTRAKRPGGSPGREQDQGVYTTDEKVSREGECGSHYGGARSSSSTSGSSSAFLALVLVMVL
jgi:hypothetical protein